MNEFELPQPLRTKRGEVRRVGVELEFSGMALPEAAEAAREAFGGELRQVHEHRYLLDAPGLGEFEVTFDSSLLSDRRYEEVLAGLGIALPGGVKGMVESVLRTVGDAILPLEVSTPPIPADRLGEVAKLEAALRRRRAEGTRAGLLYAFALHFNVEAADANDSACLLGTLRAFLLLYHWLFRRAEIDTTRRLMPFIDSFPEEYARRVVDPAYEPTMPQLIADYVRYNPTRNRPLDMLPLFALNDPELTKRPPIQGQKVKPRPAFHYRLPNSLIDEPDWSIAQEWGQWVLIERLASSPALTADLSRAYLDWHGSVIDFLSDRWVHHLDEEWVPRLRLGGERVAVSSEQ
jgi:hypothetical protein